MEKRLVDTLDSNIKTIKVLGQAQGDCMHDCANITRTFIRRVYTQAMICYIDYYRESLPNWNANTTTWF